VFAASCNCVVVCVHKLAFAEQRQNTDHTSMVRYSQVVPRFEELESDAKKYPYAPPVVLLAAGLLFFGGGGVGMALVARSNQRALILNGIIYLNPARATFFYYLLASAALGFALVLLYQGLRTCLFPTFIVLMDDAISLPPCQWSSQTVSIDYTSIIALEHVSDKYGRQYHYIHWRSGRNEVQRAGPLIPSWLPEGALPIILSTIENRSPHLQPGASADCGC
jgi:hypothetical protein